MGAGQSGASDLGGSSMGYQVLRVYPDSPGSRAGLKAYFDFIIAIGTTRFNKENGSLREILKASVDQKLKMTVLNTRTKRTREVEIVPSTSWGGNGLLGISIKHSSFDRADERVWHVVEVEPGSPAYQAGFKANEDYVIGSDSILQENDDLYNLVEAHEGKALKLFLYNVNTDNCREVVCHPNSKWGGKGYLGCEFGHGLLHRIPYGEEGDGNNVANNVRASLLRNEQPIATQELPNRSNNNNTMTFQNQLMQPQLQQLKTPTQPGQQLFQQALFNDQQQQPQPSQQLSQQAAPLQPPQHQMSQLSLGPEPQQQQVAPPQPQQALPPMNQYPNQYQQQPPPPSPPLQQQHQLNQQQPHQPYYQQQPAAPYQQQQPQQQPQQQQQQQPSQQIYVQQDKQAQQHIPDMSYQGQHPFNQPEPPKELQQHSYQQPPYQHLQPLPLPLSLQQQPSLYLPNQQQHYQQQAPPPPPPPQLQNLQYQPPQQHQQSYQQQPPPPPPPQVPQTFAQLAAASQFQPTGTAQFCPTLDGKTGATGSVGSGEGGELSNSNLLS